MHVGSERGAQSEFKAVLKLFALITRPCMKDSTIIPLVKLLACIETCIDAKAFCTKINFKPPNRNKTVDEFYLRKKNEFLEKKKIFRKYFNISIL